MVAIGARYLAEVKDRSGHEPGAGQVEHLGEQIRTLGCARVQIAKGPDLRLRDPISLLFNKDWVSHSKGFDYWRMHVKMAHACDESQTHRYDHYRQTIEAAGYDNNRNRLDGPRYNGEPRVTASQLFSIVWGEEDGTLDGHGEAHDVVRLDKFQFVRRDKRSCHDFGQ
jgi:hypothetical protein